jgi:hypothetical protein
MTASTEAKRLIVASASGISGRALKLQITPGAKPSSTPRKSFTASGDGSSRARAEQEPVVQRMKEKFGAEIRTVIDYRKS